MLAAKNRLSGTIATYEMPPHTAIELDEADDWAAAEAILRRRALSVLAPAITPIKLLLTDLDGVLTDGGMYHAEDGNELKKFNTVDGKGFELLRQHGVRTGIVTASLGELIDVRAVRMGADFVFQGARDKLAVVNQLCAEQGLGLAEIAYIGDDVGDLELLRAVGVSACPADALDVVKSSAQYVCERGGGEGCVREVIDHLLRIGACAAEEQPEADEVARAGSDV